jgi:hypothetical protein
MDDNTLPSLEDADYQEFLKQFTTQEFDPQAELAQWHPEKYLLEHANYVNDPNLPALPPPDADAGELNPLWTLEGVEMINRDMEHVSVEQPFSI